MDNFLSLFSFILQLLMLINFFYAAFPFFLYPCFFWRNRERRERFEIPAYIFAIIQIKHIPLALLHTIFFLFLNSIQGGPKKGL